MMYYDIILWLWYSWDIISCYSLKGGSTTPAWSGSGMKMYEVRSHSDRRWNSKARNVRKDWPWNQPHFSNMINICGTMWLWINTFRYLQIHFKYIQIITSIYQTFRCSPGVPGFWKIRMYRKTRYAIPQKCIGHRQNGPWFLATTCHPHWHVRQSPGLKCCKEISVWRSSAWRAPSDGPDVDG